MDRLQISFYKNESPKKFFKFFKELEATGAIEDVEYRQEPLSPYRKENNQLPVYKVLFFAWAKPNYAKKTEICLDSEYKGITAFLPAHVFVQADLLKADTWQSLFFDKEWTTTLRFFKKIGEHPYSCAKMNLKVDYVRENDNERLS